MYFGKDKHKDPLIGVSYRLGVLNIGADLGGGLLAIHHCNQMSSPVTPLFKDLEAKFLKRAMVSEKDVASLQHVSLCVGRR